MKKDEFKAGFELLEKNRSLSKHEFRYREHKFIVLAGVMSPPLFDSWKFFAECLEREIGASETVIEIGAGCGIIGAALLLAHQARRVIFSDLVMESVLNTKENIENLCLADRSSVVQSDVFDSIDALADTAFWNYPWVPVPLGHNVADDLERAFCDPDAIGLEKYLRDFPEHLKNARRGVYLGFGSNGDNEKLLALCRQYSISILKVATKAIPDSHFEYILYKLTKE